MSHFYRSDTGELVDGGLREARKLKGLAMPSPTTVLALVKGDGLLAYFRRQMFEAAYSTPRQPGWSDEDHYKACLKYADQHSKAAREGGGDLHNLIQAFHMSAVGTRTSPFIPPHFADQFDLYLRWYEKYVDKSLMVEEVVFGKGYAGRVDHVALLKDGRVAVCDIKSQDITKYKRFKQYPEHFLQLGAYGGALATPPDVLINIYVASKPPFVLESYSWPENPKVAHGLFLNVLRLWQFINNYQFEPTPTVEPVLIP